LAPPQPTQQPPPPSRKRADPQSEENYGRATGARVNKAKSVIIRMGALRKVAIPEHLSTLKTLGEGEYATILGVPFWESRESEVFWEKLYAKLKRKIASWQGIQNLSIHGRVLLANFVIYGTPRYWLSTSTPPSWFMEAIDSDVHALLWDRTPSMNKDELGSTQEGRRWITHPTYPRVFLFALAQQKGRVNFQSEGF